MIKFHFKFSNVMKRKYPRRCARYFNNQIKDSLISNNSISSTLPSSIGMTFSSSDLDSRSKKILNGSESIQSVSEYEDKARSVSHEVLDSLIREGLKNKDYETVDLVLKEALELGKLTGATMESSIRSCIDSNEFTNAWVLFEASTRLDLTIGEEVSNKIAKYMVQQIFWAEASVAIEYSLRKGYTIEKNQILIVLGGLIGVRGELDRALSLLTVIADLRREDIVAEFNVTKVEKLATEYDHMKENKLTPDLPLLEVLFNSLRQAMVQDGWWSAPLTRLTVSLACVTGNYQPAIDFLRGFVQDIIISNTLQGTTVDLLQVLREFAIASRVIKSTNFFGKSVHHYNHKADRSASFDLLSQVSDPSFMENMTEIATEIEQPREKRKSDKFQEFEDPMEQVLLSAQSSQSPTDLVSDGEIDSRLSKPWRIDPEIQTHVVNTFHLSEAILDELVMHMDSLNLSLGSLQVNSFLRLHWELAHKVQLRRPRKIKTTEDIQRLYYIARDFYKDANASEEIFSIAAGSDRRLFRYICDSLRIRQKLTATMTDEVAVQVLITRSEFTELRPHVMFLTDLLKLEGNKGEQRQIDGQPYRWKETIEPLLKSLSPQSMQSVVVSLLHSMRYSPSPSWAFLYAQTLIDSGVSFPRSMLHALLSHCNARNDPYGAVEVLHLGESIRKLDIVSNEGTGQQETAWFPLESQVGGVLNFRTLRLGSMPLRVSKFGIIDQSLETRDLLTDKDWRRAVTIAWHGHLGLPRQAFVGNFTEAIGLMRSAGKSLDESTSKIMMRFLVATQIGSPNTRQIFDSVNENKGIGVSHVECIAISRYIEFRLRAKNNPFRAGYTFETLYNFWSIRTGATYKDCDYMIINSRKQDKFIFYWSRKSVQSLYGEDFSKSLIAFWQQIHTSWGRLQLLTLLTHLLRTQRSAIRDDYKSYDRHMLVQLSMYSAFLVVSEDRQFRNAFEFLHLLMDTIVTVQTASVDRRMKSGEESNSENGKLRLNKPHKKFNPYY